MTILDAMADRALFASWFAETVTWVAWRAFLAALFGLQLEGEALAIYQRHTGRQTAPGAAAKEAWLVVGRRGGKSRIAALVAVFLGCFRDHSRRLAPGERGTIMVIAADRRQARVVFRYISGLLEGVPMLSTLIESATTEGIHLTNRISIEVHTASFRAVRGYTIIAAICDEIAYWRSEESANPDTEIVNALRPGMATVPGALLVAMSSPYARRGALWSAYAAHYAKDGDPVLVWCADTRSMNPGVSEAVIREAYEADEATASAEYGAQFRRDIESFVSREAVDAVVVPGRIELPPMERVRYFGFVDPSGGSSDSMTLAIAHPEFRGEGPPVAVLDCVRERRPPFSPEDVISEFAALLASYGVTNVVGDRFGGEFVREPLRRAGVSYSLAEKPKSDLYRDLLPLLNSKRVELLDHSRLIAQLCQLERRTARSGRDSIDSAPNAHEDIANAAAGALCLAISGRRDRFDLGITI